MKKPSRKSGHHARPANPAANPAGEQAHEQAEDQPTSMPAARVDAEATYICDSCGEEIVVPVDVSAGAHQDYVEDCPICCHPMRLHVDIDTSGEARIAGEPE